MSVSTPFIDTPDEETGDAKVGRIADLCRSLLVELGEDVERDGVIKTPVRMAKALLEMTSGIGTDAVEVLKSALFRAESHDPVMVRGISFHSLCEHHMLPFSGTVDIAYIPNSHIVGLSKLARAADLLARRPQVQERLTAQIADAVMEAVEARAVFVRCQGEHSCMSLRGVRKENSVTVTTAWRGGGAEEQNLREKLVTV